ncbi:MAG: hypothetical protein PVF47_17750 [Anaerolineae bacterium]|jgi:hypothetical protein
MSIHDLLDKMESAEDEFLETEFLAPVLPGGRVRVRIAGLVCTLRVTGRYEPGWAILKPLSLDRARVVDQPGLAQIRDYLALFPAVRLLLVGRANPESPGGGPWLALPAHRGDGRFQIDGLASVHLVAGAEPFQRITARFDGTTFWFQEIDRRRSPALAAYLRQALVAETSPEALHKATLTAEEREAYQIAYEALVAARRDPTEARLAEALAHGGAELASYIEREEAYTVTFEVEGRRHRSTVRKDDLTVLAAGICLAGQDRRFDLQSLVGVLREGARGRRLVR